MSKSIVKQNLLPLLAAFIWGTAFVAQSEGLKEIGNFTFLCLRSCLAVVFLTPVSLTVMKRNKKIIGNGPHNENKTFFSKDLIVIYIIQHFTEFFNRKFVKLSFTSSNICQRD